MEKYTWMKWSARNRRCFIQNDHYGNKQVPQQSCYPETVCHNTPQVYKLYKQVLQQSCYPETVCHNMPQVYNPWIRLTIMEISKSHSSPAIQRLSATILLRYTNQKGVDKTDHYGYKQVPQQSCYPENVCHNTPQVYKPKGSG